MDKKFRHVLTLACASGANYQPPSCDEIAGNLLDINYKLYLNKNMKMLLTDIDVFGLCYYGDGTTVNKMPLTNIQACGVHFPVAVLEIVQLK